MYNFFGPPCTRELQGDGDHSFPAVTAVTPHNGDRVHGNTAGMGTNFTVVPRGRGPGSR